MRQWFRLASSTDIKRVRRDGKSYAHPLVVLVVERRPGEGRLHAGVAAGKSTGGAVARNLIKRRIKAILDQEILKIDEGWNLLFIARKGAAEAGFSELHGAVKTLLRRARLFKDTENDA